MNIIHEIAKAIENRDEDALYRLSGDMHGMLISEQDCTAYLSIINGALEMMGELEVA
jgi:DNA-binding GntR family transcriptional regulator|tara:strand:- start:244 stop:414 length:171 start_codon:yes stop_codon:yes gene_type:complete